MKGFIMIKYRFRSRIRNVSRALSFLFTVFLFAALLIAVLGSTASAENTADAEEALPEYSIRLSDFNSSSDCAGVQIDGNIITVTEAGSYTVTGSLTDGQLRIETDKESKVRLILDNVSIANSDSAAIYVLSADKLVVSMADGTVNTLSTSGSFVQADENNVDAVLFSKDDVTIKGSGSLIINAPAGHGIVSKDDLKIKGGSISITAGSKALSANETITVEDGSLTLNAGTEGMEASAIVISGGNIDVNAGDDGLNATWISDALSPYIDISGGNISIRIASGDTDAIDSNGSLSISGGSISITASSSFDIDGNISFTGGTVIVNGQQLDSIPNQMMGNFGAMGAFGGQQGQQSQPGQPGMNGFGGMVPGGPGQGGFGHP